MCIDFSVVPTPVLHMSQFQRDAELDRLIRRWDNLPVYEEDEDDDFIIPADLLKQLAEREQEIKLLRSELNKLYGRI